MVDMDTLDRRREPALMSLFLDIAPVVAAVVIARARTTTAEGVSCS